MTSGCENPEVRQWSRVEREDGAEAWEARAGDHRLYVFAEGSRWRWELGEPGRYAELRRECEEQGEEFDEEMFSDLDAEGREPTREAAMRAADYELFLRS